MSDILYWSHVEYYEKCPLNYLWKFGCRGIDVGGGMGRSKPVPVKGSEHHILMGVVIQKVWEHFYNDELWKEPRMVSIKLIELLDRYFEKNLKRLSIDWEASPTREELYETCKSGVLGYLGTLKAHKLLGDYAKSEVDLLGWVNNNVQIGGRVDFVIRRKDVGVTILDGKNSKAKGKYTLEDQLRWYALCFFLGYRVKPDRIGFLYWRYPFGFEHDDGTTDDGVVWVDFSEEDFERLSKTANQVFYKIREQKFKPTPSNKTCHFCDYKTVCSAYRDMRFENAPVSPLSEKGTVQFGFGEEDDGIS